MINKLLLSMVTFAFALTAMPSVSNSNQQTNAQEPTKKALQQVVQKRLSSAQAMDALGAPKDLRQQEKQVGKSTETLTELTYPESTLIFVKSSLGQEERLVYFKTRSPGYMSEGIQVGDSFRKAKRVFPHLEAVEAYTYQQCDQWGRGDCLRLQVHAGRVSQVERMFVMD